MKLFRHWARATATVDGFGDLNRWGCSQESHDDALRQAKVSLSRAVDVIHSGGRLERYPYADRSLREEIVDTVQADDRITGMLSRNAYGSLVLNTTNVFFADIDLAETALQPRGLLQRLFGQRVPVPAVDNVVETVDRVVQSRSGLGLRLYKTAAGYRALVTSQTYEPTSSDAIQLLRDLGSDPMYVKLCQVQECFRARVSPKYWRCGAQQPPHRFPWHDDAQELAIREWEAAYHVCANRFATCRLVQTFGSESIASGVQPIVKMHDELALMGEAMLA